MNGRFSIAHEFWRARASRVPVPASRRNNLSVGCGASSLTNAVRKVRDREDAFASTRDACAPQRRER